MLQLNLGANVCAVSSMHYIPLLGEPRPPHKFTRGYLRTRQTQMSVEYSTCAVRVLRRASPSKLKHSRCTCPAHLGHSPKNTSTFLYCPNTSEQQPHRIMYRRVV
jgi:hypothetical protein